MCVRSVSVRRGGYVPRSRVCVFWKFVAKLAGVPVRAFPVSRGRTRRSSPAGPRREWRKRDIRAERVMCKFKAWLSRNERWSRSQSLRFACCWVSSRIGYGAKVLGGRERGLSLSATRYSSRFFRAAKFIRGWYATDGTCHKLTDCDLAWSRSRSRS